MATVTTAPPANAPQPKTKTAPIIPFAIAARRKQALGTSTNSVTISNAGAQVNLGPLQLDPTGFLRWVDLVFTITSTGNAATVAFAPDAPFNAVSSITLTNAAGDTIITPVDGYKLFLMQKYGVCGVDAPYADPRNSRLFSTTPGAGGSGGSATFRLRVPLEIDPETAFGAVPSMAGNRMLQLGLQIAPTGAIYTTAPTNAPTVQVTSYQAYWAQPNQDNGRGVLQQTAPDGNNSIQMWRVETPTVSPGDKFIKLHDVGNVLGVIILVHRTATGTRTNADVPALTQVLINNDTHYYLPDPMWQDDIAAYYGYDNSALDAPKGLDTGVRAFFQFRESAGHVRTSDPRTQLLPTLDTTQLQIRGTSYGANMSTLEIITQSIKPTDAAALYQHT